MGCILRQPETTVVSVHDCPDPAVKLAAVFVEEHDFDFVRLGRCRLLGVIARDVRAPDLGGERFEDGR
jgi:hypothetical protein